MADAFEVLGVSPDASDEEIKAAYWRLARIYHPDRYATASPDVRERAAHRMAGLNAAFQAVNEGWGADYSASTSVAEGSSDDEQRQQEQDSKREVMFRRWEEAERAARKRTAEAHQQIEHGEEPEDAEVAEVPDLRDDEQRAEAERHRRQMHAVNEVWERRNERVAAEAHAEAERLKGESEQMRATADEERRAWLEASGQKPEKKRRGPFRKKS